MVATINIHSARTANTLSAAATERKSGINLILNLNEGIKEHGTAFVHINIVADVFRAISRIIRVSTVDVKALHFLLLFLRKSLIELNCIVDLEDISNISQVCFSTIGMPGSRSEYS
jgi:hypothetical protein